MDTSNLKELASQKEKEWKEVTELRIKSLETDLKEKCQMLEDEKSKFFKLKEDFKYNLKLMNDRDKELEQYDLIFKELRQKITALSTEKSELQIKMDELKTTAEREAKNREDLQIHYQQRLREKQKEIDGFRQAKEGEVDQERKEYEAFKRKLERRLTELEEELDAQRRELTTGFDDAMKKREHEFRVKLDEMSSQVLAHELKAKLLTKELEMHKVAQSKVTEEFQQVETTQKELENQLRKKDWELADLKSVKESQISELEGKLSRSEILVKKLQQGFEQRYAELDRYGREKEAAVTRLKEALTSKEEGYKEALHRLQATLQENQAELRQLRWASQDLVKEKEVQVERLMTELSDMREKLEQQVVEVSRDQVTKDVLYQDLKSQVDKLNQDLAEKKEDVNRYKKELSSALDRESQAERSRAQTELDWQRRCEDVERQQYSKSEDLVGKLTQARDQALADVKQKERECEDQVKVIQQLRKVKGVSDSVNEEAEMDLLRAQNQTLMAAVTEMREAMEELGHRVKDTPSSGSALTVTKDYTQSLESQVKSLKKEKRDLERELESTKQKTTRDGKAGDVDVGAGDITDNVLIHSHIQSLNDSIGALRAEKVELTAQLKKQQARILYLEKTTDASAKQHRQKQLEVDQLQYEAHAEGRRLKTESAALRQRVTDLELELAETRKEADEYYRSGLERNMEVTSLTAELSHLKVELAEKRPAVNFGAQELVIQQLEDEIHRLKKHSHVTSSEPIRSGQGQTTNATLQQLQTKLKSAAKHITQLARDKQLLIEIGNRQRAELLKAGISPPSAASKADVRPGPPIERQLAPLAAEQPFSPANPLEPPAHSMSDRIQDKLDALEKLQYQLTKQELQYAQKFSPRRSAGVPRSARSRGDNRNQPVSILKKSGDSFVSDGQTGVSTLTDGRTEDELMLTISSAGDSLQEVWGVLNQPSPSPVPSKHTQDKREGGNDSSDWLIKGRKADIVTQQTQPAGKQRRSAPPKKHSQKPKVRNYNVKDGVS